MRLSTTIRNGLIALAVVAILLVIWIALRANNLVNYR